jgi:putative ABC transport system permease protein
VNAFPANLGAALRSISEQRSRAALSALGVMVGAIAIILLISIAKGVQKDLTDQVNDLGVNVLVVLPFRVEEGSLFMPNAAGLSYLREDDVERVRKVPGVRRATPIVFVGGAIKRGDKTSPSTLILSAGGDWFKIRPAKLQEGELYTPNDEQRPICVIGSIAKEKLFGTESAVGQLVSINGREFRVIGVTEDKKHEDSMLSMGSFENIAYIPYGWFKSTNDEPQLHRIMVQVEPDREPAALKGRIESALGERLDHAQYSVQTLGDLLKLVYKLMGILTWLLTGLTSIALFVGGVGIMTVMLMSVNERSKEIGVRKTVGARRADIFLQFLIEAVILSLIGGLVGLGISAIVCWGLKVYTPIKPLITWDTIGLCFAVSVGVGAFFGLLPAMRAARRDPVEALRNE